MSLLNFCSVLLLAPLPLVCRAGQNSFFITSWFPADSQGATETKPRHLCEPGKIQPCSLLIPKPRRRRRPCGVWKGVLTATLSQRGNKRQTQALLGSPPGTARDAARCPAAAAKAPVAHPEHGRGELRVGAGGLPAAGATGGIWGPGEPGSCATAALQVAASAAVSDWTSKSFHSLFKAVGVGLSICSDASVKLSFTAPPLCLCP